MNKNIKICGIILMITVMLFFTGCGISSKDDAKLKIVTTNFSAYDFVRAIIKDVPDTSVKMLLKPGSESHNYEPTPQDLINIKESDLFIYVGGDSDSWIDNIIDDIDTNKTKLIKLMDLVSTVEETTVEGMEEETHDNDEAEYDEHVWTSPINAIQIINKIKDDIILKNQTNKDYYENNASLYEKELTKIDLEIREVVKNSQRNEIIFGDRFPLRYFVDEYGLTYYAAFPGCSEQTETSANTISFLINKVREDNIPVVFTIELSSGKIAKVISEETGAKILEFKTAHNISQEDFDKGITYVDLMNKNIDVLKEALN